MKKKASIGVFENDKNYFDKEYRELKAKDYVHSRSDFIKMLLDHYKESLKTPGDKAVDGVDSILRHLKQHGKDNHYDFNPGDFHGVYRSILAKALLSEDNMKELYKILLNILEGDDGPGR